MHPERHGQMTGLMKAQIDYLPLILGGVRPTQGQHARGDAGLGRLAELQRREQLRLLGRWMRMLTIPNQSSVAKALTRSSTTTAA